ncbi:MAG TPA: hypothetical protein VF682_13455 [Pseudomonas sp.]
MISVENSYDLLAIHLSAQALKGSIERRWFWVSGRASGWVDVLEVFFLSHPAGILERSGCHTVRSSNKNFLMTAMVIDKHLCIQTVEW